MRGLNWMLGAAALSALPTALITAAVWWFAPAINTVLPARDTVAIIIIFAALTVFYPLRGICWFLRARRVTKLPPIPATIIVDSYRLLFILDWSKLQSISVIPFSPVRRLPRDWEQELPAEIFFTGFPFDPVVVRVNGYYLCSPAYGMEALYPPNTDYSPSADAIAERTRKLLASDVRVLMIALMLVSLLATGLLLFGLVYVALVFPDVEMTIGFSVPVVLGLLCLRFAWKIWKRRDRLVRAPELPRTVAPRQMQIEVLFGKNEYAPQLRLAGEGEPLVLSLDNLTDSLGLLYLDGDETIVYCPSDTALPILVYTPHEALVGLRARQRQQTAYIGSYKSVKHFRPSARHTGRCDGGK